MPMIEPNDTCDADIDGGGREELLDFVGMIEAEAEDSEILAEIIAWIPPVAIAAIVHRGWLGRAKVKDDTWPRLHIPKTDGDTYRFKILSHATEWLRGRDDPDGGGIDGHAWAIALDAIMAVYADRKMALLERTPEHWHLALGMASDRAKEMIGTERTVEVFRQNFGDLTAAAMEQKT